MICSFFIHMYEDEQNYINSKKIENISLNTISLNIFLKKYFFVFLILSNPDISMRIINW